MRTLCYAFLLGLAIAGLDTAALFTYDGNIRFLNPSEEMWQLYWRHGLAVVGLSIVLRFLRPQWRPETRVAASASMLFFGLSFLWIHSRLITGVRLWEPVSLLASVGLLAATWVFFRFWASCLHSLAGNATLAIILIACSGWILAREVDNQLEAVEIATEDLPDITLVVFDTLRADRLSCYGYERNTSPNIDAVAKEGTQFNRAFAVAPWTRPSIASIFTGLHPTSHGAFEPTRSLPEWANTMAEVLQKQGYQTGGFSANANISAVFGFAQGFEYFWCLDDKELLDVSTWGEITFRLRRIVLDLYETADDARLVNAEVFPWLDKIDKDRPVFTYVQYLDPHFPYTPPIDLINENGPDYEALLSKTDNQRMRAEPFPFGERTPPSDEVLQGFSLLYDAEIRFMDREFKLLLDKLEVKGLLDENDWLILTSDHGEEFFEHRQWGHGQNLYDEVIHIPLIIKGPDAKRGLQVDTPVSLVDLLPTLAGIVDAPLPECVGQPMQNLLVGRDDARLRRIYSEKLRDPQHFSLQLGNEKYSEIFHSKSKSLFPLYYDLEQDPEQQTPFVFKEQLSTPVLPGVKLTAIAGALQKSMATLKEILNLTRAEAERLNQGASESELDPAMKARLAELGYL